MPTSSAGGGGGEGTRSMIGGGRGDQLHDRLRVGQQRHTQRAVEDLAGHVVGGGGRVEEDAVLLGHQLGGGTGERELGVGAARQARQERVLVAGGGRQDRAAVRPGGPAAGRRARGSGGPGRGARVLPGRGPRSWTTRRSVPPSGRRSPTRRRAACRRSP